MSCTSALRSVTVLYHAFSIHCGAIKTSPFIFLNNCCCCCYGYEGVGKMVVCWHVGHDAVDNNGVPWWWICT